MTTYVSQGTLNRLRCQVMVPNFPALNITAPYMGKSFARISFQGKYNDLLPTATGAVTSPEPYVLATISVGLLRPQALSTAWLLQAQLLGDIGPVTIWSDTSVWPALTSYSTVIGDIDPGAYDGTDPVVRLTLDGVFPLNSTLWQMA